MKMGVKYAVSKAQAEMHFLSAKPINSKPQGRREMQAGNLLVASDAIAERKRNRNRLQAANEMRASIRRNYPNGSRKVDGEIEESQSNIKCSGKPKGSKLQARR
jgi:hypothetical protein